MDYSSLVFTDNAYYWNSRQENGNAIDYLTRHMGFSFKDAVYSLLSIETTNKLEKHMGGTVKKIGMPVLEPFKFSDNMENVKSYFNIKAKCLKMPLPPTFC
jgi:hypothetical protein